jgi:uncharacterized membrane protein YfcA
MVWIVAIVAVFLGGVCQGLTGFGFGLIVVPVLALAWDVKAAVVLGMLVGIVSLVPLLIEVREQVRFRPVLALLAGTVAGTPVGVAMLVFVDADALKLWVAAVVICLALLFPFNQRVRLRNRSLGMALAVGTISGLLRGSTSMGGPPIAFYLLGSDEGAENFRTTFLAYLLPATTMALTGFLIAGKVTPEVLAVSAVSLPGLFLGLRLGASVRHGVPPRSFQTIVLGILVLTSGMAIASVLVG